jgi:hypothetical protein
MPVAEQLQRFVQRRQYQLRLYPHRAERDHARHLAAGEVVEAGREPCGPLGKVERGASVQGLQEVAGRGEIFTMTVFVALRLAFSTVNDALGILPDAVLDATVPPAVLDAVTTGRPVESR